MIEVGRVCCESTTQTVLAVPLVTSVVNETIVQAMSYPWTRAALVAVLAAVSAWLLSRGRREIESTTLVAPWRWAHVSLFALAGCEVLLLCVADQSPPRWAAHLRFFAAATTFCPTMAQLGAKRPQDRAWQFIVASLWVVVALPAAQSLVYAPGRSLDLDATWRWFLLLLIVLGAANGLPTRFWPSWLLVAIAQGLLFAGQLPLGLQAFGPTGVAMALGLLTAAAALASFGLPRAVQDDSAFDRQWRDFRDAFGTLWALRIAERFNAAASMYGWSVRLHWRGLVRDGDSGNLESSGKLHVEDDATLQQVWHSLVLRFVSPEWLAVRSAGLSSAIDYQPRPVN